MTSIPPREQGVPASARLTFGAGPCPPRASLLRVVGVCWPPSLPWLGSRSTVSRDNQGRLRTPPEVTSRRKAECAQLKTGRKLSQL